MPGGFTAGHFSFPEFPQKNWKCWFLEPDGKKKKRPTNGSFKPFQRNDKTIQNKAKLTCIFGIISFAFAFVYVNSVSSCKWNEAVHSSHAKRHIRHTDSVQQMCLAKCYARDAQAPRVFRCFAHNFMICPNTTPTSTAESAVPMPTLPILRNTMRQVTREIRTIVMSNPTLTFGKAMLDTWETACMIPSPASGIISAGR